MVFRSSIHILKQKHIRTASLSCRIVSSQKDLDQAAVVPCSYEEMEERDDDSKKCRTVSIFQVEISKSFHWE
jgi:ferredoxin-thioredoxin reductase catalytic subunit